jgi:hypothetical protein
MSDALKQLAYLAGTFLAMLVLAIALLRGMPFGVALFRAAVVMCVGTAIVALFFRSFTMILYRFLQEKMKEHRPPEEKRGEGDARRAFVKRPIKRE